MKNRMVSRNKFMLKGPLARKGYDWWWHNFTGYKRSTGEPKSFFIEYYVCNPALGGVEPVFGQLEENRSKNIKPSYAMIKAGFWGGDAQQIHNFYGINDFQYSDRDLYIRIGDCILTETKMEGSCALSREESEMHREYMSGWGSMSWNLAMDKQISYNVGYGASPLFRAINAFEMFWHAEGIKTLYSGEVVLNDEIYDVFPDRSYGYADKNWGADYTSPWLWISSCRLKSLISGEELKNSAVEIGGGNPKVFGFSLGRKLLGCLYYEGTMHDYNFSKFWTGAEIKFNFIEQDRINIWKVEGENRNSRMEMELECPKDEMLLVNYEAPNGTKLHNRLWNGGTGRGEIRLFTGNKRKWTLADRISVENAGCEYGEYGD